MSKFQNNPKTACEVSQPQIHQGDNATHRWRDRTLEELDLLKNPTLKTQKDYHISIYKLNIHLNLGIIMLAIRWLFHLFSEI